MKPFLSLLTVFGLLATACSTSGGGVEGGDDMGHAPAEPGKVAGGQSGNDGTGSYSCDLSEATVSDTPVDTIPEHGGCSPAEFVSRLSWATTTVLHQRQDPDHSVIFDCGGFGRFVVEVGPATSAQVFTGTSPSDTSEETPDVPCVAFVVEAAISVRSLDGAAPFAAHKLETDHICWDASFVAERADGAKLTGSGDIATGPLFNLSIASATETVACERTRSVYPPLPTDPDPSPSEPSEPGPNQGGAGGEGGARDPGQPGGAGGVESGGEGGAQ